MCIALGGAWKILLRHIPVSKIEVKSESTKIKKRTIQDEFILFITTLLILMDVFTWNKQKIAQVGL